MQDEGFYCLDVNGVQVQLLPQKAIFIDSIKSLLVSDVHLGKSETFQAFGVPIPKQVNHESLDRLKTLCLRLEPEHLFILGDLFHSPFALVEEVVDSWIQFVKAAHTDIHLIIGNHDRNLIDALENLLIHCYPSSVDIGGVRLSHEPEPFGTNDQEQGHRRLNICGHIHPCIRLRTRLDDLRLPCFYLEEQANRLTLPSFGAFTGGFEVSLTLGTQAYAIAEETIIPFESLQNINI
ncbi:MAG: ligase-associated DNA damage response endonuclease PdeM [Cyanobacteria bacterium P01_E01_bin.6]